MSKYRTEFKCQRCGKKVKSHYMVEMPFCENCYNEYSKKVSDSFDNLSESGFIDDCMMNSYNRPMEEKKCPNLEGLQSKKATKNAFDSTDYDMDEDSLYDIKPIIDSERLGEIMAKNDTIVWQDDEGG